MITSGARKILTEMPWAIIGDGEQTREVMDFFYELDGELVAFNKDLKQTFVWDWIKELGTFFKSRKWKMVDKRTKPPHLMDSSEVEPYTNDEIEEWIENIVSDSNFMNILRQQLTIFNRKKDFINNKDIPMKIKTSVLPELEKGEHGEKD